MYKFSTRSMTQLGMCLVLMVCMTFFSGFFVGLGVGRMEATHEAGFPDERAHSSSMTGKGQQRNLQDLRLRVHQGQFVDSGQSIRYGPDRFPGSERHVPAFTGAITGHSLNPEKPESVTVSGASDDERPSVALAVPPRRRADTPSLAGFGLQVGAFRMSEEAERWLEDMKERGFQGRILEHADQAGRLWHRVVVGRYATYGQADAGAEAFEIAENIPVLIRKYD